ncbi:unnamed protein product [Nyctereutes procyonoides]|uniref:(raccoon dog) hypothetical protein n=1 Tax=Nyctereutes procyonoides TaxID=34880 RepID=A0A811ZEQ0_NYCPR|nr:unnamed protein product [Nyctereutes procyonoides]
MSIFKILLMYTVFSHTAAEIHMLIDPVNLPENMLPGKQLSGAYDKDVAGKAEVYHFLRILRHVLIINIINVRESPDCTADPWFSSGTSTLEIDENHPLFQSIYTFFQFALRATVKTRLFCQRTLSVTPLTTNCLFLPFPLNSVNVTKKNVLARVKAPDQDEDSPITSSFKTQQEMFGLHSFKSLFTLLQILNPNNPRNPKTYSLEIEARDNGNNTSFCGECVTVSVPENIPASTLMYKNFARTPDPGQEVEVCIKVGERNYLHFQKQSCLITGTWYIEFIGTQNEFLINEGHNRQSFVDCEDVAIPHSWILYFRSLTYTDKDGTVPNNNITYHLITDTFSNETPENNHIFSKDD